MTNAITQIPTKFFYEDPENGSNETLSSPKEWELLDTPDYAPADAYSRWMRATHGINVSSMTKYYRNSDAPPFKQKGNHHVRITSIRDGGLLAKVRRKF